MLHNVDRIQNIYLSDRNPTTPTPSTRTAAPAPLINTEAEISEEIPGFTDSSSDNSSLPSFIVLPPSRGDGSASVPPPIPPRPSGSTGTLTPPGSLPPSLQPSPKQSLRSPSPPPLPSRSPRASLTVPNDLLTDTPAQRRYYDTSFTQQRGGSEPLLNTFPSPDQPVGPPPIPARPGQKSAANEKPHLSGPPPPMPPRPYLSSSATEPASIVATGSLPPPLPYRHRPSLSDNNASLLPFAPPLPPRHQANSAPVELDHRFSTPPVLNNRPSDWAPLLTFSSILPPPTRTVAKDKVPKPRYSNPLRSDDSFTSSSSSSESESEKEEELTGVGAIAEAIHKKRLDEFPDSTHSSRRKPAFRPAFEVHAPAHVGVVAVAGNCVCVGHHSIKVYDLDSLHTPLHSVELKDLLHDLKIKDNHRITALGFRPAVNKEDEGRYLWCGMKDGHLFEFDAWNGVICDVRPYAHAGAVTNIMRYGRNMVTVGDAGKAFVFSPPKENADLTLGRAGAAGLRYIRVPERQGFVQVFGHQLWTANGPGNNGTGGATAVRGPTIRVYDLESGATGASGTKTLIASDPVGQVTCGTILPSRPEKIYLGHEGGTITIWNRDGIDGLGTPNHTGTIKVGTSDVLSLEGVRARLWAGSRVGTISTYDVETLPWTVTNTWRAHEEYPVFQIEADPYSIEKVRAIVPSSQIAPNGRLLCSALGSQLLALAEMNEYDSGMVY